MKPLWICGAPASQEGLPGGTQGVGLPCLAGQDAACKDRRVDCETSHAETAGQGGQEGGEELGLGGHQVQYGEERAEQYQ